MFYATGVQPCNTAVKLCVKLSGVDYSLATHERLAIPWP